MPLTPILRKPSVMSPVSNKKVLFCMRETARSLIFKFRDTRDPSVFASTFEILTTSASEDEKISWLSQMTECVPLLDQKVDLLVLEFLKIPWYKLEKLSIAAESFIINLVTAHNYYTYSVLKQLFTLITGVDDEENERAGVLSENQEAYCWRLVGSICAIHKQVPIMITIDVHTPRSELMKDLEDEDSSDEEEMFNMEVDDGDGTIEAIRNEIREDPCMSHRDGNTLDVLMDMMFHYIHDICHGIKRTIQLKQNIINSENAVESRKNEKMCHLKSERVCHPRSVRYAELENQRTVGCECGGTEHDLEALKSLFSDLKEVFSRIILTTHASSHTQFLLFYLLALRPGLATHFLEYLRVKKFENPNCFRDERRNAMAYIGSLLARGKFIPFSHVHSCLEIICAWCYRYLDKQETVQTTNYEDLQLHSPFYFACQTVFYVFTFRYKEYTENSKKLALAQSLNLERLVLSPLNPLRMCAAPIVSNFAAVTRRFQLAYCYTIMENNKRLQIPSSSIDEKTLGSTSLDMFFPFDPYLLVRSRGYVANHYREFDGLPEEIVEEGDSVKDEEALDMIVSPKSLDFSYGLSPGYQKW
ncbi:RNA polymerase I-specific transcription initiation factor RRN3-like isoform X4 [Scylla paramamosain]|uniref:RNA polymerase I-specific transcription initiation factor RRN3-like isoform X4 n=1 Tax=Scylla paramamosain TaxID=85552 RepID=UPI00308275C8